MNLITSTMQTSTSESHATIKSSIKTALPKAKWDLDSNVRLLMIILMDPTNRAALASTGAKATRKDLDTGDSKKLSVWNDFAKLMNDAGHLVTPGKSSQHQVGDVIHLPFSCPSCLLFWVQLCGVSTPTMAGTAVTHGLTCQERISSLEGSCWTNTRALRKT